MRLANGAITLFINDRLAVIDGLRKLRNWLLFLLVAFFKKNSLFSKDPITFMLSFISLFVRFILKPIILSKFGIIFLKVVADFTNLSSLSYENFLAKSCSLLTISYITINK